jgi:hypothetical protein
VIKILFRYLCKCYFEIDKWSNKMICIEEESINPLDFFQLRFEKEELRSCGKMRRDGTRKREAWDGMGLSKKNEAGWDGTGPKAAGHGTGRDDFLVVPRSSVMNKRNLCPKLLLILFTLLVSLQVVGSRKALMENEERRCNRNDKKNAQ